jgi:hypothetical protein
MDCLKLAYHPTTGEVRDCGYAHFTQLNREFDKWVRVIYWPDIKRLYVRFYAPDGLYEQDDTKMKRAFNVADRATRILKDKGFVKKAAKVLYWETDKLVTDSMVRY